MAESAAGTPLSGGLALLERAIGYALGSVQLVTPARLSRPTPCREWDLRALLEHLHDSLAALQEAADAGHVGNEPAGPPGSGAVLADTLRDRACHLLGTWVRTQAPTITVACQPVSTAVVACVGALEIAVHGWDIARACDRRPIPAGLAADLLVLAPRLVTASDRPVPFAPPVDVPLTAAAGDRLVGFLGRSPG